jgi:hypothetical protein
MLIGGSGPTEWRSTMSDQGTDYAAMARPRAEHEKLQPFEGTFRAEVKLWMGPGDPHTSSGTMVNRWALGGLFLEQIYTGDPSDGPFPAFEGRGFWGYNPALGKYEGVWVDNAGPMIQFERGTLDGKVWTMIGEVACGASGKTMTKRSVITLESDDRHRVEMYFNEGQGEHKAMEIRYVRSR